ncbi:MAG: hypothetical protein IPG87_15900 [Saprospiraceae bacterium]|nr:hypothetical protein [Candidatus Vicinibacter affinis]
MIDFYELLDEYVEGKLDPTVRRQFEIELNKSQDLQIALENYILAKEISQSMIELSVREQISNLKNKKNNLSIFARIAAGLLVLFSVGILYKLNQDFKSKKSEQIFVSLYSPPMKSASRSGLTSFATLDSAIYYFDRGEFQMSKDLFSVYLKQDPKSAIALKYMAHLGIQEGNYIAADKYFQELIESDDSSYHTEAYYHMMILAILKNDKDLARKIYKQHIKGQLPLEERKLLILEEWLK